MDYNQPIGDWYVVCYNQPTKSMSNRAVFIDRDGTIAPDVHYCRRVEDFKLFPNVAEAIKLLNSSGFKVVVITNQSGIARGYFTEEILNRIHNKMKGNLAEIGAHVDAIYYCPHHPDENCECRKPKPVFQAVNEFSLDLQQSFVIGDRLMDVQLAKTVGCKAIMIANDLGIRELENCSISPDYITSSFESAVRWILE